MTATGEQEQILARLEGPLRIAAGAGTGKTDTLRRAIVELIGRGVRPGEILCLTFTVEATKEMRRRVLAAFEGRSDLDADEITVQTYHAFAASMVREHALLLGLDGDPALLDRAREWQLFLEALEQCSFRRLEIKWLPTFIGRLLTFHDELQRHVAPLEQVREWCQTAGTDVAACRLDALSAVERYAALKRKRNAIDFGDQIALAVSLLGTRPDIAGRIRERFRYIFLDEYQDTDVALRELVKLVAAEARLVCAVGDVDQGIFGWRGATIHNMTAFPRDFPGARTETLSVNFRSGRRILDLANELVASFVRPDGEVRAPLVEADGAADAAVEAFVAEHNEDEAEGVAARIEAAGPPWSQYAVLVRKRSQLDALFAALTAARIPAEVDTLGGFWTRPEILDVQAWLHLLADPGDNIALARILLGPAYRLSRRDFFFLAQHAKEGNMELRRYGDREFLRYALIDALVSHAELPELSEEARERLEEFRRVWRELAAAARVSLADLVGEVARVSGLATELAASPDPAAEVALRHLAKLRDLAHAYQPVAGSADLEGFVTYLNSIEESDQDEDELRAVEENAVKLMTIYRAKGLEWDTVFLPGLSDGILPNQPRTDSNPATCWFRVPFELRGDCEWLPEETDAAVAQLQLEEERRLMYVGITRAKRRLVLSRAWFYWDNKREKAPSPFWDEALATGLVRLEEEVPRPDENPRAGAEAARQAEPPRVERVVDRRALEETERALERLRAVEAVQPRAARWRCPSTLSVTAFLTYIRDPEEFFWRYVRRVPSAPSPAAKLGIELHRRIEQWSRGGAVAPAPNEEEPYDLDVGERRGDGAAVSAEQMWENFQRSRFAAMKPLMTEQPFTLYVGHGLSVEGRIDAIFEHEDGSWEVVDYKTGTSDPDPLQLAIYGRAVEEIWRGRPRASWLILRSGDIYQPAAITDVERVVARAAERLCSRA
jgi:DNA helicase-2/ATP-dependent DNA helicase PcrA